MNTKDNIIINDLYNKINENDAYNIRQNGKAIDKKDSDNITIVSKKDKSGIDIYVKDNTFNNCVHIPVVVTKEKIKDVVYNDFFMGENAIITIYASCTIHNDNDLSTHEGIHTFHLGRNSKVKYIEQHEGHGEIHNNKNINTSTEVDAKENSIFIMKTIQKEGVDNAFRKTNVRLDKNAIIDISEKLLTKRKEIVSSSINATLNGINSRCNIVSKAVAKNTSKQSFHSNLIGNSNCIGHVECNAIMVDNAIINSSPTISSNTPEAILTHEAAIGKIAKEEIIKLMSLGLNEKEAEKTIIEGFLK